MCLLIKLLLSPLGSLPKLVGDLTIRHPLEPAMECCGRERAVATELDDGDLDASEKLPRACQPVMSKEK